jgi:peptidoglycan pentaglycine glycine transferase (the first glycine)
MSIVSSKEWDQFLSRHPNAHILQTSSWGELKAFFGWEVVRLIAGEAGALILFKSLPLGLKWAYIPKGPLGQDWKDLWGELDQICRRRGVVFLKVEPDCWAGGTKFNSEGDVPPGFHLSPHKIQPARTLVVDLRGSEDQILSRMKQKTRYNIGLASRKGVKVQESNDILSFYQLMEATGERETFGVHSLAYYQKAYDLFSLQGQCALLAAEYEGEPLASLMVFARGERAWYFYGASSNRHRNLMPTYLLQWEAMRWASQQGCKQYDLWGVPDEDEDILEAEFAQRQTGLWGVYRFKRGFGGELKRAHQPWDRVYHPIFYYFYLLWVKNSQS